MSPRFTLSLAALPLANSSQKRSSFLFQFLSPCLLTLALPLLSFAQPCSNITPLVAQLEQGSPLVAERAFLNSGKWLTRTRPQLALQLLTKSFERAAVPSAERFPADTSFTQESVIALLLSPDWGTNLVTEREQLAESLLFGPLRRTTFNQQYTAELLAKRYLASGRPDKALHLLSPDRFRSYPFQLAGDLAQSPSLSTTAQEQLLRQAQLEIGRAAAGNAYQALSFAVRFRHALPASTLNAEVTTLRDRLLQAPPDTVIEIGVSRVTPTALVAAANSFLQNRPDGQIFQTVTTSRVAPPPEDDQTSPNAWMRRIITDPVKGIADYRLANLPADKAYKLSGMLAHLWKASDPERASLFRQEALRLLAMPRARYDQEYLNVDLALYIDFYERNPAAAAILKTAIAAGLEDLRKAGTKESTSALFEAATGLSAPDNRYLVANGLTGKIRQGLLDALPRDFYLAAALGSAAAACALEVDD